MSPLQIARARGASAACAEAERDARVLGEPRAAAGWDGTDLEYVASTVSIWHHSHTEYLMCLLLHVS